MVRRLILGCLLGLVCSGWSAEQAALIQIKGAIGPATASYIARAIRVAKEAGAQCLIIQLDTPGGLLESTKDIVQSFYDSPVPTVVFVSPSGASAGSAGCFITLAADVAAMAPNTTIGAAHPVAMGGGGGEQKTDEVMKQKMESFASSFMESIAHRRQRNVEWAVASVKESASITAEQALEKKVIDLIAKDVPDLLKQIDGRRVQERTLKTSEAQIMPIPMITRERVFQMLWRPEIMFILMLMAVYGILGELSNPGAILPGVVGAISLILALYLAAVLPVNVAGVALLLLAVALFIADIYATTHGVLTAGGIISFFLGALMLFDRTDPLWRLSLGMIIPATILTAAFFIFVVGAGLKAQLLSTKTGKEGMIGLTASVVTPTGPGTVRVFVEGEYWNAVCPVELTPGQQVEIEAVEGLTLKVKPKPSIQENKS